MSRSDYHAVWVCGAAGAGKSAIAAAAVAPLGFELLDVDVHADRLEAEYAGRLSEEPAEEGRDRLARARTRRHGERLALRVATADWVDPGEYIEALESEWEERALDEEEVRRLAGEVRRRFGGEPVRAEAFLQALWPKMGRLSEPEDYLAERSPLTRNHLLAVARESLRRQTDRARSSGRGLLFVETGVLAGRLLRLRRELSAAGYRTLLVWVSADLPAVLRRNARRKRCLPDATVAASFAAAGRVGPRLREAFSPDFILADNSCEGTESLRRVVVATRRRLEDWLARPAAGPGDAPAPAGEPPRRRR